MKKIYLLFTTALTLGFTACEDIPAPYGIFDEYGEVTTPGAAGTIIDESFSSSLGSFKSMSTVGSYSWVCDYSCAQITSYVDGTNHEAESWLVSAPMDLTEKEEAHVSFEYILRYANSSQLASHYQLRISKDYDGINIANATWETLPLSLSLGSDWNTWYESGEIAIPAEYCKTANVYIALFYKATTKAATWEVRNLKVKEGAADAGTDDGTDEGEEGDNSAVKTLPYEETFETSLGAWVNNTTSGSGSWINDFKTAKASGYDNATKVTTAGTYYLVSPQISLEGVTEAHISYEYILRYNKGDENQQIFISTDYADNAQTATWKLLNNKHTEGADWTTFEKKEINIPAEYMGKTVRIAFYYNTNATSGSTIEIKNFAFKQGNVAGGDVTPDEPVVDDSPKNLPYSESFSSSLGAFKSVVASGGGKWINEYNTAKASNYDSATKETTVGTLYLVSPAIVLTNAKTAFISYESIVQYNKGDENQQLVISKDYNGDASTATWTVINQTHVSDLKTSDGKTDWKTFEPLSFAVPAEFLGGNVYVAFRYNAEASGCSTWEVRNFAITETKDEGGTDTPDTPAEVGGLETFTNGGFEEWDGSTPLTWKSTTSAGNATLSQSTDAHSGDFSVKVGGIASANKRLGSQEMKLAAGSYTMKFWTKAATAEGGSVRPGYVPLKSDGSVGSYVYGEYVNDLTNTTWVEVTHNFELTAETTLNIVVMNAKKPGKDVLIDDFTITKN